MGISIRWMKRQLALWLVLLLAAPYSIAAINPQSAAQASTLPRQAASNAPANRTQAAVSYPDAPTPVLANPAQQAPGQQSAPQKQQQTSPPANQQATPPVGTAAAPYIKPEGVPVSKPAGAAIAPAKQRRAHTFAIRIALLVGAGVAVGTVVALSKSSPSRPN